MQPKLRAALALPAKGQPLSIIAAAMLVACGGGQQSADGTATAEASVAGATVADSICFYEHINYQGQSFCAGADNAWVGATWNDKVSSVKVKSGYKVQLFEHSNYGGTSLTLAADTATLVSLGFNDKASSFKVTAPVAPPPPPPPPTSSKVSGIQLAQSLLFNTDDSQLVLVSGKAALVKVNVTTTDTAAPKPSGTLRVDNVNGGASRDLLLTAPTAAVPTTVPQVPSFSDSYTAFIPADLVKPGLRLTVQVGGAAATTLTPRVGGGVPMRFVPISVKIAGVAGTVPVDQAAHIQALFPVATVSTQAHPAYTSSRVTILPTTDAGWSDAFGKVLGELADLHTIEGAGGHDHYFGFIPKRTWGLAGLAYVRGSSGVGFDMPSAPTTVRDVVAHELGHNFSLPHAACGGAGSPDPNYPYPDANLGKPGRYVWPFLADSQTFYDPRPTDRHDIMSYCGGQVFSDYNYRQMQVYLTPSDKAMAALDGTASAQSASPTATAEPRELLLVSGELGAASAELHPVKSLMGKPSLPDAGPYTLRVVTATGTTDYAFTPRELDHDATVKHFGFTIPNPGAIVSLSVLYQGQTLVQTQAKAAVDTGTSRAQGGAKDVPTVQVQESSGRVQLTWDSRKHPFVTVTWVGNGQRVNLGQDLRGGSATLTSNELPSGGSFELIFSDGLNSVRQLVGR
jgi:hypothetical protein